MRPYIPIVLPVVMKGLNGMLNRAREHRLLKALSTGVRDRREEVTHLFFTDGTLFFCEPDRGMSPNIYCILIRFQIVLELNINLVKFEIVFGVF